MICILLISVFFLGKHLGGAASTASEAKTAISEIPGEQNLRISFAYRKNTGYTTIPLEHGNYNSIKYLDADSVTIDIDGTVRDLEDALRGGYATVDELIAWARKDASLGLCREAAESKNGLTEFTYYYVDFRLRCIYDLYETPDGAQHLMADCLIYDGRSDRPHFLPVDRETGTWIDYEDWGLSFEISGLDPSGITITCSQSGGQQIGALAVDTLLLSKKDPNTLALEQVQPLVEEREAAPLSRNESGESYPISLLTMSGKKELSFDFGRLYGELPAGDYVLSLKIVDLYHEEDVPPLARNYHDEQWYNIEFSIDPANP